MHDEAWPEACGEPGYSRWPSAGDGCGGGGGRSIGGEALEHPPVPDLAVRTAVDLDGGDATHEGLCVLARLRVRRRHGQQLAGQCQLIWVGNLGPKAALVFRQTVPSEKGVCREEEALFS